VAADPLLALGLGAGRQFSITAWPKLEEVT
jgi:hypothetical protein